MFVSIFHTNWLCIEILTHLWAVASFRFRLAHSTIKMSINFGRFDKTNVLSNAGGQYRFRGSLYARLKEQHRHEKQHSMQQRDVIRERERAKKCVYFHTSQHLCYFSFLHFFFTVDCLKLFVVCPHQARAPKRKCSLFRSLLIWVCVCVKWICEKMTGFFALCWITRSELYNCWRRLSYENKFETHTHVV